MPSCPRCLDTTENHVEAQAALLRIADAAKVPAVRGRYLGEAMEVRKVCALSKIARQLERVGDNLAELAVHVIAARP